MNYLLVIVSAALIAYVVYTLYIRLQLSLAKHPSLRGHSKWSRRLAKHIPYFEYTFKKLFECDGAPRLIARARRDSFEKLAKTLRDRSPTTVQQSNSLADSISDMKFTNAYRVPFPFRKAIEGHFPVTNLVIESNNSSVKDLDNNWMLDLSGSYGVNLFGYDFYKECMQQGLAKIQQLGPVLGQYHPIILENVKQLKKISGLEEVSFHMSGTEAVMQAVRLARYHTGRTHLVRFCGAYHGWWDGVQPGIGNQRKTEDVYTLSDMSEQTLKVLAQRKDIACVLINPLQALSPNSDASGDASLVNSSRHAKFEKRAYIQWLQKLQKVCRENQIVIILDEVFTGFRLAYRGAAEYFNIQPDIITYGKTLGGGLPVGVVCGKSELMMRYKTQQPANVSFARGTFNSHPMVMACMQEFLTRIKAPEFQQLYANAEQLWDARFAGLNQSLEQQGVSIRIENLLSVCTVIYTTPSRFNWMFQFYLRKQNLLLSWVGSGRFIFNHSFTDEEFDQVSQAIIKAAIEMKQAGWWWANEKLTNKTINRQMLKAMVKAKFPLFADHEQEGEQSILMEK